MNKEFNLTRNTMIEGAEDFARWLTDKYGLSEKGLNGNIEKWKEQLK